MYIKYTYVPRYKQLQYWWNTTLMFLGLSNIIAALFLMHAEQMKGCQSKGGLRMELTPIRLHTRPNSVATFTCAFKAHLPLNINFHMLGLGMLGTKVVQSVARMRREEMGAEEIFPWSRGHDSMNV